MPSGFLFRVVTFRYSDILQKMDASIAKKNMPAKVVPTVVKLVAGVAKAAQAVVSKMVLALAVALVLFLAVMGYFWGVLDARWLLLLPGLVMGVPLLGMGAFVYLLYCVAHLPNSFKEAVSDTSKLKKRHVERAEKLEGKTGLLARLGRLQLTASLLWDVAINVTDHGGTVDDAFTALWLFNPLFWVIMLWCVVAVVATQVGFTLFCFLHWLF